MAAADDGLTIREINFRTLFPFTLLFRSFRVATHLSKLVLALILLLFLYFGGRVMDSVWRAADLAVAGDLGYVEPGKRYADPQGIFITFFSHEAEQVNRVADAVLHLNWGEVVDSVNRFVVVGPAWLFVRHPLFAAIFTLWFLLVWSIFGGAISRIAAVHVARDEKIAVRQALRFSIGKVLSFLFAPLIPLAIFFALGCVLAAAGVVLLRLPVVGTWVGPAVVGVFFFLALAVGFVMTLVLLGTVGGFNLMYPTIAVEGSDSFDAISRSFSYAYARPWRMVFYTIVAVVYGSLTYLFVRLFVFLMLLLTHQFVGWWLGTATRGEWARLWQGPQNLLALPYDVNFHSLNFVQKVGAGAISFWVYLAISLIGAYAISFYFSANTVIYYLLRREVDATELDDVYLEESEEEFSEAPPAPAENTAVATGSATATAADAPAAGTVPPPPGASESSVTPPPPSA